MFNIHDAFQCEVFVPYPYDILNMEGSKLRALDKSEYQDIVTVSHIENEIFI